MSNTYEYGLDETGYEPARSQGDGDQPLGQSERYSVDFKHRAGRFASYLFTLFLVFLGGYTVLHYGVIENMTKGEGDPRVILGVIGVVIVIFIFDIFWLLYAMMTGKPAIEMDERGIRGFHGGLWRDMAWEDVGYIYYRINQLIIVRKPKSDYQKLLHRHTSVGGRMRPEHCIVVPLKHVDVTDKEILKQIDRFYPDAGEHVFAMVRSWFTVGAVNS